MQTFRPQSLTKASLTQSLAAYMKPLSTAPLVPLTTLIALAVHPILNANKSVIAISFKINTLQTLSKVRHKEKLFSSLVPTRGKREFIVYEKLFSQQQQRKLAAIMEGNVARKLPIINSSRGGEKIERKLQQKILFAAEKELSHTSGRRLVFPTKTRVTKIFEEL